MRTYYDGGEAVQVYQTFHAFLFYVLYKTKYIYIHIYILTVYLFIGEYEKLLIAVLEMLIRYMCFLYTRIGVNYTGVNGKLEKDAIKMHADLMFDCKKCGTKTCKNAKSCHGCAEAAARASEGNFAENTSKADEPAAEAIEIEAVISKSLPDEPSALLIKDLEKIGEAKADKLAADAKAKSSLLSQLARLKEEGAALAQAGAAKDAEIAKLRAALGV